MNKQMTTTEIRIEGCLKNIEKTQKTLERHQSRLAKKKVECQKFGINDPDTYVRNSDTTYEQFWVLCDYYSIQDDIKNNLKKLEELQEKLRDYRTKKAEEDRKNDVPIIPVVEEFLQRWRATADKYYREQVQKIHQWKADYKVYYDQQMEELKAKYEYRVNHIDREVEAEKKERKVDYQYKDNQLKKLFTQDCLKLASYSCDEFEVQLNKMLDDEVNFKRADLYHRCSAVVGVITDATGLKTGSNGSINGVVIGENSKAKVETILAGGYNIQILHYRVLVKPLT